MKFFLLLVSVLCTSRAFATIDPTAHFTLHQYTQTAPPKLRRETDTFYVQMENGQKAILQTSRSLKFLFRETLYPILASSVGLPFNAKYPTFVNSQNLVGYPSETFVRALVEPSSWLSPAQPLKPDAKLISEYIMHIALMNALGADFPQSHEGFFPIRLARGEKDKNANLKTEYFVQHFIPELSEISTPLQEELRNIVYEKFIFTTNLKEDILHFLNMYLVKLETIPEETIKNIFAPIDSAYGYSVSEFFLLKREVIREQINLYFQSIKFGVDLSNVKIKSRYTTSPIIHIPSNSHLRAQGPIEDLWENYYFAKPIFNLLDLMNQAKLKGTADYIVAPYMNEVSQLFMSHQTQLNPTRSQILVVNPVNDIESKAIFGISKKVGIYNLLLEVKHGYKLTEKDINLILEKARELNSKTIMTIELPGMNKYLERKIQDAGYELIIIDHHSYNNKLARKNRLSSLEQFTKYIGYKLSPREYIIAIMDRSFVYGLQRVGVEEEEILQILKPDGNHEESISQLTDALLNAPTIEFHLADGTLEKIYVLTNPPNSKLSNLSKAVIYLEWPKIGNVLTIQSGNRVGFKFVGKREIVSYIIQQMNQWRNFKSQNFGGDLSHIGYWSIEFDTNHPSTYRGLSLKIKSMFPETKSANFNLDKANHIFETYLNKSYSEYTCSQFFKDKIL